MQHIKVLLLSRGGLTMSHAKSEQQTYARQFVLLSALTPGHSTHNELIQQCRLLGTEKIPGSTEPACRFLDFALFDTDEYRAEILRNVDKVLERYQGDFLAQNTKDRKVEKDLLWAFLQLYGHLQAIEQEVGLILEPKSDYARSLKNLESCYALLQKNGSNLSDIDLLIQHKPVISNAESGSWYEKAFKDFIDYIDARNNTRLFWVWGRPNLDMALEAAGQADARDRLADTTYWPGHISWSLYLFRGSFFALKMFAVWWNNPKWLKQLEGLTSDERAEYRLRYLMAYWDVYKYRILNDYVWGPINLACLEWLIGLLSWFGDFATCFLLYMDLYLADLTYEERAAKYLSNDQQYRERYAVLTTKIIEKITTNGLKKSFILLNADFENIEDIAKIDMLIAHLSSKTEKGNGLNAEEAELTELLSDLNEIAMAQKEHSQRWEKEVAVLKIDCIYTKALLVAFAMWATFLVGAFLPVVLSAFLAKSGTILCLALTIGYRTVRAQLQITQDKEERAALQVQEEGLYRDFLDLKTSDVKQDKNMQALYLHLQNIGMQINFHTASIQYQYLELARTTLLRVLVPTLIGLTLVYAPVTVFMVPSYVLTLAASAALAYGLDRWAKTYKPESVQRCTQVDSVKYQTFFAAPKVFSEHVSDKWFFTPVVSLA